MLQENETATRVRAERKTSRRMLVRYKVKADRAAENEGYITNVFAELRRENPAGLRYASFKLDDGVSFVHIVSLEAEDGGNPLRELSAFKEFTDKIEDRCEEAPTSAELNEIGSYGFFVD